MMRVALDAARKAVASQDIPVGAAIFNNAGELISVGHNERELHNEPTAHAEIVAIRAAAQSLGAAADGAFGGREHAGTGPLFLHAVSHGEDWHE